MLKQRTKALSLLLIISFAVSLAWFVNAPKAEAVTYQRKVINSCDIEYFILGPDGKRLAPNDTLDRTKQYTVRFSISKTNLTSQCLQTDYFESGYIVQENTTTKYIDSCYQFTELKDGDNNTVYADKIVSDGGGKDKEVWRYFRIAKGINTTDNCKVGTKYTTDITNSAVFVRALWQGTPPSTNTSGTVPNTNVAANFNVNLDETIGDFWNPLSFETVPQLITTLIRILFVLIGIAAVVVIIIAGFRMVIASGNEAELTKAKQAITWAIIGLVVSLMAFSIVAIIQRLIQVGA